MEGHEARIAIAELDGKSFEGNFINVKYEKEQKGRRRWNSATEYEFIFAYETNYIKSENHVASLPGVSYREKRTPFSQRLTNGRSL